jgi:uncharacterized membrane protein
MNQISKYFLFSFFIACTFFTALTPSLQSPDEFDHVKRAYALGKGTFLFRSVEGRSSGTEIDSSLAQYIAIHHPIGINQDRKISVRDKELAQQLQWGNKTTFSETPATSYYFPLIYMPQAIAFVLGEKLGLSIDLTYRMARSLALNSSKCRSSSPAMCAYS